MHVPCGYSILKECLRIVTRYQENDSLVTFLLHPEQSPPRKVAVMDKSLKPPIVMHPIKLPTLSVVFALTGCLLLAPDY